MVLILPPIQWRRVFHSLLVVIQNSFQRRSFTGQWEYICWGVSCAKSIGTYNDKEEIRPLRLNAIYHIKVTTTISSISSQTLCRSVCFRRLTSSWQALHLFHLEKWPSRLVILDPRSQILRSFRPVRTDIVPLFFLHFRTIRPMCDLHSRFANVYLTHFRAHDVPLTKSSVNMTLLTMNHIKRYMILHMILNTLHARIANSKIMHLLLN